MFAKPLIALLLAATAATPVLAQPGVTAGPGEIRRDRAEARRDRAEVRDQRQDYRRNLARGDFREAARDRQELQRDRAELRESRRELRSDRRGDQPAWADRRDDRRDSRWAGGPGRPNGNWNGGGNWNNNGNWNNGWRNDRRYDWQGYRQANRRAYTLPRYYAPGGYGYRRFGVGNRLDAPFLAQRYWIADPYAYRLPPAYGPYRWVRYFDDVLLIDTRTGQVRDVVNSFFW